MLYLYINEYYIWNASKSNYKTLAPALCYNGAKITILF